MIPHLAQSDIVTASYSISNTIYPKSTHIGLGMGKKFHYKMHFTLKLTLACYTCRSTDLSCSSDFKAHKRSHFKFTLCSYYSIYDISFSSIGHRSGKLKNLVLNLSPVDLLWYVMFQSRSYYQILWVFSLPQHDNS